MWFHATNQSLLFVDDPQLFIISALMIKINLNEKVCHQCFSPEHLMNNYPNGWVCKICHESGHKMMDCPKGFYEAEIEQTDTTLCVDHAGAKNTLKNCENTNFVSVTTPQQHESNEINKNSKQMAKNDKHVVKHVHVQVVDTVGVDKGQKSQQSLDKFVKTPQNKNVPANGRKHTPPESERQKKPKVNDKKS